MGLPPADYAPSGLRWQVEAEQFVVTLRNLLGDCSVSKLLGQAVDLVVEHVREALEEKKGEQVVLELGCVLRASVSNMPRPKASAPWAWWWERRLCDGESVDVSHGSRTRLRR